MYAQVVLVVFTVLCCVLTLCWLFALYCIVYSDFVDGLHFVVFCAQVMLVALCCLHCVVLCAQVVLVVLCCLHCVVLCA